MRNRVSLWFVGTVLTTLVAATPASAGLIVTENSGKASADATFTGTSFPNRHDEAAYGPFGGAAVADVNFQFGRMRGVQLDLGLNAVRVEARVSDIPFFDFSAKTSIDLSVGNVGVSTPLDFEYTINAGQLALRGRNGSFDGLVASVGVTIFTIAPGFSGFLWSWVQTLRGSGSTATTSVDFLIDPLNFGTPALSPITITGNDAVMDIAPFHVIQNLGLISGSDSAFITYNMDAFVGGPGLSNTGGVAALGDPFGVNASPGSTIGIAGTSLIANGPAPIPEPSTLPLLAAALGLLALQPAVTRACRALMAKASSRR